MKKTNCTLGIVEPPKRLVNSIVDYILPEDSIYHNSLVLEVEERVRRFLRRTPVGLNYSVLDGKYILNKKIKKEK